MKGNLWNARPPLHSSNGRNYANARSFHDLCPSLLCSGVLPQWQPTFLFSCFSQIHWQLKEQLKHRELVFLMQHGFWVLVRLAVSDNFSLFFSSRVSSPLSSPSSLVLSHTAVPSGIPQRWVSGPCHFFNLFFWLQKLKAHLRNIIQTCILRFGVHILRCAGWHRLLLLYAGIYIRTILLMLPIWAAFHSALHN